MSNPTGGPKEPIAPRPCETCKTLYQPVTTNQKYCKPRCKATSKVRRARMAKYRNANRERLRAYNTAYVREMRARQAQPTGD